MITLRNSFVAPVNDEDEKYGISKMSAYKGMNAAAIQRMPVDRRRPKAEEVVSFLDNQAKYGEVQPDTGHVHLNHPSRKVLHEMFLEAHPDSPVNYSYFVRLWRTQRKNIKLRKVLRFVDSPMLVVLTAVHRLAKCDQCVLIRDKRSQNPRPEEAREIDQRAQDSLARNARGARKLLPSTKMRSREAKLAVVILEFISCFRKKSSSDLLPASLLEDAPDSQELTVTDPEGSDDESGSKKEKARSSQPTSKVSSILAQHLDTTCDADISQLQLTLSIRSIDQDGVKLKKSIKNTHWLNDVPFKVLRRG